MRCSKCGEPVFRDTNDGTLFDGSGDYQIDYTCIEGGSHEVDEPPC